jgi:hypothetical protein
MSPQGSVTAQAGVPQVFEFVDIRANNIAVDWYMLVYNGGQTQFLAARPDDICPPVPATEIRTCKFSVDLAAGDYTYQVFAQARFLRFKRAANGGTAVLFNEPTGGPYTYRLEYGPAPGNWPHWIDLPTGGTHHVDIPPGDWHAIVRVREPVVGPHSNEVAFTVGHTIGLL